MCRGPDMVRLARERLSAFPNVEVQLADFEATEPARSRDAVVAATSYHWLDARTRAHRCAEHLRPAR